MQKIVLDGIWELGICSNDTFRKNKINIVDLDSLCNSNITVIEGHVPGNHRKSFLWEKSVEIAGQRNGSSFLWKKIRVR